MIFGKADSTKLLTQYQIAINEASARLAMSDPSLLLNRGKYRVNDDISEHLCHM